MPEPTPLPEISELTLEEKASLTSGADFWTTKAVERVGIPSILLTDGPHGLRKQAAGNDHLGLSNSVPATCFPPAVGMGATWDPELAHRVGAALGVESAIEDVAVILGPGINIKRSPLCGRNFEYLSEDPIVSGVLGAGLVNGIQSQGVGASLKHFAANNQEDDRMRSSSDVDPRPLREIYLRGFHRVVEESQPWTVMCSYNRLNGVYTSEDPWLLTDLLRGDWGFEGLVVSDWGAVNDRVVGLPAGLDLEMPSSDGVSDAQLVAAVRDGRLEEAKLDLAAGRVLDLIRKSQAGPAIEGPLDVEAHHALAREAAARAIVLLKNDGGLLPLRADARIAVVGAFAEQPRYQGAGSSLINPTRVDKALDSIREHAADVTFAAGFTTDGSGDAAALRAEAVAAAAGADVVVAFLGLPTSYESEGYDRVHINLPEEQLVVLDAVLEANPNVVVVLSNGGAVALPFADRVPAIVEGWLLGQAGGSATADVLFGVVNPSGKLTETLPLRLEDNPSFGNFPGEFSHVRYGEGLLVGYRWYDAKRLEVAFPFGHGLSYTSFGYGEARASINADGNVLVSVDVTNTGAVEGREIVQVYTSLPISIVQRPPRELKAFGIVDLAAGETRTVELLIRRADLSYWDIRSDSWVVEGGDYTVEVGASSRDLRTSTSVAIEGDADRAPLHAMSTIGEGLAHPVVGAELKQTLTASGGFFALAAADDDTGKMLADIPLARLGNFPGSPLGQAALEALIARSSS
jgi:beta-glucosidase